MSNEIKGHEGPHSDPRTQPPVDWKDQPVQQQLPPLNPPTDDYDMLYTMFSRSRSFYLELEDTDLVLSAQVHKAKMSAVKDMLITISIRNESRMFSPQLDDRTHALMRFSLTPDGKMHEVSVQDALRFVRMAVDSRGREKELKKKRDK